MKNWKLVSYEKKEPESFNSYIGKFNSAGKTLLHCACREASLKQARRHRDFALHGWASIFGLEGGRRRKWAIKSRGRRKGKGGGGSQRYGMHGKRGRTKRGAENRKETERKTLCILYKRMVFIGSKSFQFTDNYNTNFY